jgi:hypothetical protein
MAGASGYSINGSEPAHKIADDCFLQLALCGVALDWRVAARISCLAYLMLHYYYCASLQGRRAYRLTCTIPDMYLDTL